jgi:hypothetical protein
MGICGSIRRRILLYLTRVVRGCGSQLIRSPMTTFKRFSTARGQSKDTKQTGRFVWSRRIRPVPPCTCLQWLRSRDLRRCRRTVLQEWRQLARKLACSRHSRKTTPLAQGSSAFRLNKLGSLLCSRLEGTTKVPASPGTHWLIPIIGQ